MPSFQRITVYDKNRKPAHWMDLIQPAQYAVFLSDVRGGAEINCEGKYPDRDDSSECLIFDSLLDAGSFCREKVDQFVNLRCDVFDSQGRTHPPVATFVNQTFAHLLDTPESSRRLIHWGFVSFLISFPLFLISWKYHSVAIWGIFFGLQAIFLGLRFIHWGYSQLEELHDRKVQAELRAKRNLVEID